MLRGLGLQNGEELLPELAGSEPPPPVYDQAILTQLTDMGFPPEACKRALFFTENRGLEVATNWLMEHITDSDFADPFVPPGIDTKPGWLDLFFYFILFFYRNCEEIDGSFFFLNR